MFLITDVPAAAEQPPAIVVTASRAPESVDETTASVSVIDADRTRRLGEPLAVSLLREVPSAAVSISGPAGSISEVRIRGAEANHTLLFVDGIKANDPAAGNIPRFELLNADTLSRIEVVRGPQSALWGSEAIGGVVAVSGNPDRGGQALSEAGSNGFGRVSGKFAEEFGPVAIALGAGFQRSGGIDAFAGSDNGDRDGYRNLALRGRLGWRPTTTLEFGGSAFAIRALSEFDGYDASFQRADTADETRNRLAAGRLFGRWQSDSWHLSTSVSRLRSANRNSVGDTPVNRTEGGRTSAALQVGRTLATGSIRHQLIVAFDHDREQFKARDQVYFGATDQNRDRSHCGLTGEWRAEWGRLITDLAVRRDAFDRFKDATTLRASARLTLTDRWSLAASYGEGIAQPSFFDLYGFFPNSFVGNQDLKPERSAGWEASGRYGHGAFRASATYHRQQLTDEIIDVFLPGFRSTTANAEGRSRRSGIELEGKWAPSPAFRLGLSYAYLKASERRDADARPVREARRPKHSGAVTFDGSSGHWSYGASVALTGDRRDTDFDSFPARPVTLDSYWLANGRLAYQLTEQVELFGRVANGFDANYQDAVGYRTEGRSAYAGIRFGFGR
jgi:vitamin B12 transporter